MNVRKPKTFWTSLILFVIGVVGTINIIRFPNFAPLAIFFFLIGIGFIVAGYGLWIMKKWGAILATILAIIVCFLKLILFLYWTLGIYTLIGIIIYVGVILLVIQEWGKLK